MSPVLYSRGIWWRTADARGYVKDEEFTFPLSAAPNLLPGINEIDFGEIDGHLAYCPEIVIGYEGRREMHADEIARAQAWLTDLHERMAAVVGDHLTLPGGRSRA